jgi:hypothetical protein
VPILRTHPLRFYRELVTVVSEKSYVDDDASVYVSFKNTFIYLVVRNNCNSHPRTGHEGSEGSRSIAVLFLQPRL